MKYNSFILLLILFLGGCSDIPKSKKLQNNNNQTEIQDFDQEKWDKYSNWTDNTEYESMFDYNITSLKSLEKNRDSAFLMNFLASNYENVKPFEEFPYEWDSLYRYLYALDFNGDSLTDVFYQGPSGGEPYMTQIFMNKGDSFKKVFTGYQYILEPKFIGNKLVKFTLRNPGCCADPSVTEYHYTIKYNNGIPVFSIADAVGYVDHYEKMQKKFATPIKFTITSNQAKLRNETYILDSIDHPSLGVDGNAFAVYNKGTRGIALGNKVENGVEWVFVKMYGSSKPSSCVFDTFMEQPTEIYGWTQKSFTDLK